MIMVMCYNIYSIASRLPYRSQESEYAEGYALVGNCDGSGCEME